MKTYTLTRRPIKSVLGLDSEKIQQAANYIVAHTKIFMDSDGLTYTANEIRQMNQQTPLLEKAEIKRLDCLAVGEKLNFAFGEFLERVN